MYIHHLHLTTDFNEEIKSALELFGAEIEWKPRIMSRLIGIKTKKSIAEIESLPFVKNVEIDRVNFWYM